MWGHCLTMTAEKAEGETLGNCGENVAMYGHYTNDIKTTFEC